MIRLSFESLRKPAGSADGSLWLSSTCSVPPSSPTGSGASRRPCWTRRSESRTEVSRTYVRRAVTSRLPLGARHAPDRRWPGPGAEAGHRPPVSTNSSAPTGPPVDGEVSSPSTPDGRPAHRQKRVHHPEREGSVHPEGYQPSLSSQLLTRGRGAAPRAPTGPR